MSQDPRYLYGQSCTWHGPIAEAEPMGEIEFPDCPKCGGPLQQASGPGEFWTLVRATDREQPGYEAMMRWSQGRCFPDLDTLENAYRQAMAGVL
jgi:hypothetical protein